jgi:mono/diheme cytochrome c family protein
MKMTKYVTALLAASSLLFIGLYALSELNGEGIYKMRCIACHGADGNGTGFGKSMGAKSYSSPQVVKMPDAELFNIIKNGKSKMPAFRDKLSDSEIKSVIGYIRGLK